MNAMNFSRRWEPNRIKKKKKQDRRYGYRYSDSWLVTKMRWRNFVGKERGCLSRYRMETRTYTCVIRLILSKKRRLSTRWNADCICIFTRSVYTHSHTHTHSLSIAHMPTWYAFVIPLSALFSPSPLPIPAPLSGATDIHTHIHDAEEDILSTRARNDTFACVSERKNGRWDCSFSHWSYTYDVLNIRRA